MRKIPGGSTAQREETDYQNQPDHALTRLADDPDFCVFFLRYLSSHAVTTFLDLKLVGSNRCLRFVRCDFAGYKLLPEQAELEKLDLLRRKMI